MIAILFEMTLSISFNTFYTLQPESSFLTLHLILYIPWSTSDFPWSLSWNTDGPAQYKGNIRDVEAFPLSQLCCILVTQILEVPRNSLVFWVYCPCLTLKYFLPCFSLPPPQSLKISLRLSSDTTFFRENKCLFYPLTSIPLTCVWFRIISTGSQSTYFNSSSLYCKHWPPALIYEVFDF